MFALRLVPRAMNTFSSSAGTGAKAKAKRTEGVGEGGSKQRESEQGFDELFKMHSVWRSGGWQEASRVQ